MARLRDGGPWFLLRLVDDAYDVRDVDVTADGVAVTWTIHEDYTLAVGCGCRSADGRTLVEVFGRAGEELVFERAFEPAGAAAPSGTIQVAMTTVDGGRLLRYFDAWSP